MGKVGILYICTGKYRIFWDEFYKTAEKFLLPNSEKTYFVFTDAEHITGENKPNVKKIYQQNLKWPGNTLFRYRMFIRIEDILSTFDYLFFFNANIVFLDFVFEGELLPREEGLMAVNHPVSYNKKPNAFPYERSPKSLAYVPFGHGSYYCLGGVNGGRTKEYFQLIRTLDERIMQDYRKGVIAVYHDESHFNRYIMGKTIRLLTPSYGYPEGKNLPFHPRVLIKDKKKWGGHQYLRS